MCANNTVTERASLLTPIPTYFSLSLPLVDYSPAPFTTVAISCKDDARPLVVREGSLGMLSNEGGFGLKEAVYRARKCDQGFCPIVSSCPY